MFTLFAHEVKYYFKNKKEAIYIYSYFASIILLTGFNNTDAEYRFVTPKGYVFEGKLSKTNLAQKILEFIQ